MPVPPPPPPPPLPSSGGPPPAPPPLPSSLPLASTEPLKHRKEDQKARSALLTDIQQGTRLRKVTQISDRSAPQIETEPKGPNRDGGSPANSKSGAQSSLGGLFAGGFPILKPVGQREMTAGKAGQLPGVRVPPPKSPAPLNSNGKASSNISNPPDCPRAANPSELPSGARAAPARPSMPAPPPPPPVSSKPFLVFPPPPPLPSPLEKHAKVPPQNLVPPPPPPPQSDKPAKVQATALYLPPPPPPLPLAPPYGLPVRTTDFSSTSPPQHDFRDYPPPTPPPPPPPLPPTYSVSSPRGSLPLPPSSTFHSAVNSSDVPPPLPPKSPHLLSQFQKPGIQSMPLPPAPPFPQPAAAVQKRRQGRGAVSNTGKLIPPPLPPARSPSTELTSKYPYTQVSSWPAAHEPYPQHRNGNMQIIDDFESKFTFHSVEEFPPPDEFKPFQRIYPSKASRDTPKNPPLRTHVR